MGGGGCRMKGGLHIQTVLEASKTGEGERLKGRGGEEKEGENRGRAGVYIMRRGVMGRHCEG